MQERQYLNQNPLKNKFFKIELDTVELAHSSAFQLP